MNFAAIAHPQSYRLQKLDALLFDNIGFVRLERNLLDMPPEIARETEWLLEKGVIRDVAITIEAEELPEGDAHKFHVDSAAVYLVNETLRLVANGYYSVDQGLSETLYYEAADSFAPVWNLQPSEVARVASAHAIAILSNQRSLGREKLLEEAEIVLQSGYEASARITALCLTKRGLADAVPILTVSPIGQLPEVAPLQPVASVVLEAMPSPDAKTPWEAIVDFRKDEYAVQSLRRLRSWLRALSSHDRSLAEIRDEVEHMVHEYLTYLSRHKIKSSQNRLEILLSLAADAIDKLGDLKVGSTAKALFQVRTHRMSLYEIERATTGREVAYITEARQRFGGT
jgi:hypothetical protein